MRKIIGYNRRGGRVASVNPQPGKDAASRPSSRLLAPENRIFALGLLLLATLAVYYPVNNHPFVNYDDDVYVTENYHVRAGLSLPTVKWALTTYDAGNWHPVTWISHALDYQLFRLNAGPQHDVNLLLHAVNVSLLFWVLLRATGCAGRSLMVAALFALHPVNVETVVWIAERKSLLSMLFFLLALGAYRWYALRPRLGRYLVMAGLFALGLMAKPQVITLPLVLLLWDYWPLQRMSFGAPKASEAVPIATKTLPELVWEKLPLLAMSGISAAITLRAQRLGGAMSVSTRHPLPIRLENAIVAYARYVGKAVWPTDLAPMYPHPGNSLRAWQVGAAFVLLMVISAVVVEGRPRRYLLVGWLWFLGTLVPMIGLVQVGLQAMADRYAYLPFVGLFIMVCWAAADWAAKRSFPVAWQAGAGIAVLLALATVTHFQIDYWSDNVTLWTHTLQVTTGNWVAEDNLGGALLDQDELEEAMPHFARAAAIHPSDPTSNLNIAFYEQKHRELPEAIEQYKKVISMNANNRIKSKAFSNMGYAYRDMGEYPRAIESLKSAVSLNPRYTGAWIALGALEQKHGDLGLAIQAYYAGLNAEPVDYGYVLLARALEKNGQKDEAEIAMSKARGSSKNISEAQRVADQMLVP